MKILSITTSSKICGVAILEDTSIIKEINSEVLSEYDEHLYNEIKNSLL